jgi:hypothetical protein
LKLTNSRAAPSGVEQSGDLTMYNPSADIGACGFQASDEQLVAAIPWATFDAANIDGNPNNNPLCNQQVTAHRVDARTGEDTYVTVTIVDRCKLL